MDSKLTNVYSQQGPARSTSWIYSILSIVVIVSAILLYLFNLNITVKHTFFIFLAFAIENLSLMNETFELFIVLNIMQSVQISHHYLMFFKDSKMAH